MIQKSGRKHELEEQSHLCIDVEDAVSIPSVYVLLCHTTPPLLLAFLPTGVYI